MAFWDEMTEQFEGWQDILPTGSGQITSLDATDVQIVYPSAEEIKETILNGNGNGNGNGLAFASSAGGAFILGLVILAMSGFRG